MTRLNPKAWSSIWERPTLTTFVDLFPDNYDDAILDFWKARIRGESGHIVDLACGNGALVWICNDILNESSARTTITGIDIADIHPFEVLERNENDYPYVKFVGNASIENLPFEDSSVDHVISQYGVEYSDIERTVAEIGRVVTRTGKISLMLHDQDSVIVRNSIEYLDDIRRATHEIKIHDDFMILMDLYELNANVAETMKSAEYRSLIGEINRKAEVLRSITAAQKKPSPVKWYLALLNHALKEVPEQNVAEKRAKIAMARDTLIDHIERMEDLETAALSPQDHASLITRIEEQGFEITDNRKLMYEGKHHLGSVLAGERSG